MAMLISPVSNSFDPLMQFRYFAIPTQARNLSFFFNSDRREIPRFARNDSPQTLLAHYSYRQPDKFRVGRILGHLGNGDRAQHLRDAFIHSPERLAHRALGTLIAVPVVGHTGSDHQRPVHGVDYIQRRNFLRMPGELIAPTGTVARR